MTTEATLFDQPVTEPAHVPVGSLARALHFAEQAKLGRLDALEALDRAAAEVSAFVEQQRRTAAARDAEVTGDREGKVVANPASTSAKAARNVEPRTGTQRARVLVDIVEHAGATDHEIARRLSMLDSSVRPRRGELAEGGYVVDSGRIREHQGSDWTVWQATANGMSWYRRNAGGES
jgi:hypothetical protein